MLVRLLAGNAPDGQHLNWTVFTGDAGDPLSALFLGVVFGFLSFAGFEAAATLGEETSRPRRDIPRAILGMAIFGGIYFVVVTAVEVMGFGTPAGRHRVHQLHVPDRRPGHHLRRPLARRRHHAGAMVSAFGCALATTVGAARLPFAMSRDGILPARLSHVSRRHADRGHPGDRGHGGHLRDHLHRRPFHATRSRFLESGTIGTLILLVVYVLATLGCTSWCSSGASCRCRCGRSWCRSRR